MLHCKTVAWDVQEYLFCRLPCFVNRLEGFVMLWKRGESIITVGDQIVDKEVRLEAAENGNNLVIGPASPEDEQQYTCQISSYKPSEIVHSVKVRGEPFIQRKSY